MNRKFNNNNYFLATVATISFLLLFSTITNPLFGYDLDDVKPSIAYEEAIDEFDYCMFNSIFFLIISGFI